jgi:putative tricarboxylic transport membrane protein
MEENLRRALALGRGDLATFVHRPLSAALLALALVVLVAALLPGVRRRRDEVFTAD